MGIDFPAPGAAQRADVAWQRKRGLATLATPRLVGCRAEALRRRLRLSLNSSLNSNRRRHHVVARELVNLTVVVSREPVHFAGGAHQFERELALLGLRRLHPKLDGFTGIVDAILEADTDRDVLRKQRHTAHRIFERLREAQPGINPQRSMERPSTSASARTTPASWLGAML